MEKGERSSVLLGLVLGGGIASIYAVVPPRLDHALVMVFIAIPMAVTGVRVGRRMRAPFAALGLGVASVSALVAVYLATVHGLEGFSPPQLALVLGTLFAVSLLFAIEATVHPGEWRAWGDKVRDSSLLDFLLLRHVPQTR